MSWNDNVVIVTGGGSGIGRAVAHRFAEVGAEVVIVGRTLRKIKVVAEEIRLKGHRALAMAADVSNETDVTKVIQDTLEIHGRIDVLINSAAVCPRSG